MKLNLSKKYYSIFSIEKTIEKFSKIAVFVLKEERGNFILEIDKVEKDCRENFREELCNYLLGVMIKEIR